MENRVVVLQKPSSGTSVFVRLMYKLGVYCLRKSGCINTTASLKEITDIHLNDKFPDYSEQPDYILSEITELLKQREKLTELDFKIGLFRKVHRLVHEQI